MKDPDDKKRASMFERQMTIEEYIEYKIKMLEDEFKITLTPDEKQHFHCLKTEREVDKFAWNIIDKKL